MSHSHYFQDVSHLDKIDVYRVIELFGPMHPAQQHALKKVMCAGKRGSKDAMADIQEAIDSLERWKAMLNEDKAAKVDCPAIDITAMEEYFK